MTLRTNADDRPAAYRPFPEIEPVDEIARRHYHLRTQRLLRSERLERLDPPITRADQRGLVRGELAPCRARQVVQQWHSEESDEQNRPWLMLLGPPGVGKTLAALEVALESAWSAYIGARALEQCFGSRFGAPVELQDRLRVCPGLLVLDDLGRESDPTIVGAALLELIDARRSDDRMTIAIANLNREQLEQRYPDPRLASRLAQSARWGVCSGPDFRRAP
ncbi:MAG TPA: hypothetical protein VLJ42_10460 [Solirubrobacteraceae bacterium]|nr:hypothetical protein [Solirubrobacteraceae bacterium]